MVVLARFQVSDYECSVRVIIGPAGGSISTECLKMLEGLITGVRMNFLTREKGEAGGKRSTSS